MEDNKTPIRTELTELPVDGKTVFPITQTKSVRSIASDLGLILDRKYTTKTNRSERTITVRRLA